MTPTVCQILGINDEKNSFLGTSIFESMEKPAILATGFDFYCIDDNHIVRPSQLAGTNRNIVQQEIEKIKMFYACEEVNQVFH